MAEALRSRVLVEKPSVSRSSEINGRVEFHVVTEIVAVGTPVESARPPLSVALLLDGSASMRGAPMREACRAVRLVAGMLKAGDELGVSVFDDRAAEIAPLGPVTREARRALERRLETREPGGRSNLEAALREGKRLLGRRRGGERRVVLLVTDGRPTTTIATTTDLEALAATFAPDASLATLGVGPLHDAELLARLASRGGGQFASVPGPRDLEAELSRAIGTRTDVVADEIRIFLEPADGVEVVEVHAAAPRFTRYGVVVDAPDLREGSRHVVVARVAVEPSRERGPEGLMTVRVAHRHSSSGKPSASEHRVVIAVADQERTDTEAHLLAALALAERTLANARDAADARNFEAAGALLTDAITGLERVPLERGMEGSFLFEAIERLVAERAVYESRPRAEETASRSGDERAGAAFARAAPRLVAGDPEPHQADDATRHQKRTLVIESKSGEQECIPLEGAEVSIGRLQTNDVCLPGGNVSKRHARVTVRDGRMYVTDLSSTNGTYVNRRRIDATTLVKSGDRVYIGNYVLRIGPTAPHPPDAAA